MLARLFPGMVAAKPAPAAPGAKQPAAAALPAKPSAVRAASAKQAAPAAAAGEAPAKQPAAAGKAAHNKLVVSPVLASPAGAVALMPGLKPIKGPATDAARMSALFSMLQTPEEVVKNSELVTVPHDLQARSESFYWQGDRGRPCAPACGFGDEVRLHQPAPDGGLAAHRRARHALPSRPPPNTNVTPPPRPHPQAKLAKLASAAMKGSKIVLPDDVQGELARYLKAATGSGRDILVPAGQTGMVFSKEIQDAVRASA